MDQAVFDNIIEQLHGRPVEYVAPYLMADPLADKKIFERIRQIRTALPAAVIEISTTGKYLVPSLTNRLLEAPITELRISSHGITDIEYKQSMPGVDFNKAMPNILNFIRLWKASRPFRLAIVCLWGLWSKEREREIESFWADQEVDICKWRVTSRAQQVNLTVFGQAESDPTVFANRSEIAPYMCRHNRDTEWIHILSDGRVTLCCMDYKQEVILGNICSQSIDDIYNSTEYKNIRRRVRTGEPAGHRFLCDRCEWHVSQSLCAQPGHKIGSDIHESIKVAY